MPPAFMQWDTCVRSYIKCNCQSLYPHNVSFVRQNDFVMDKFPDKISLVHFKHELYVTGMFAAYHLEAMLEDDHLLTRALY